MRIYNVNSKTSKQQIVSMIVLFAIVLLAFVIFYINTSSLPLSVSGFFKWYAISFQSFLAESEDDKFFPVFLFILLPLCIFLLLIYYIVMRHIALQQFKSDFNLLYIDLLPDRVFFCFNSPQYNFVSRYCDINSLSMVFNTILVHTKNGQYIKVKDINLSFKVLNNKELVISNTPVNLTNFVYSIIDYTRSIENFSYSFNGAGIEEGIKEKIEDYRQFGLKQILTKNAEVYCKFTSISFFVFGIYMLFAFKDIIENSAKSGSWFMLVFPLFFMAISFIFDIVLIADKIKERKYKYKYGKF